MKDYEQLLRELQDAANHLRMVEVDKYVALAAHAKAMQQYDAAFKAIRKELERFDGVCVHCMDDARKCIADHK